MFIKSNYDLIFLICPETTTVDSGVEPDEEKQETAVTMSFVKLYIRLITETFDLDEQTLIYFSHRLHR